MAKWKVSGAASCYEVMLSPCFLVQMVSKFKPFVDHIGTLQTIIKILFCIRNYTGLIIYSLNICVLNVEWYVLL